MVWDRVRGGVRERCTVEVADEVTKTRKKKDRRHWCKGRKGIEHQYEWRLTYPQFPTWTDQQQVCLVCGRKGERRYMPIIPSFRIVRL